MTMRAMVHGRDIWITALLAIGCAAVQPGAPAAPEAPLRELPWSNQINFLHTTDTHGWHAGHLTEPSFSGDWGDYISFAHRLRQRANKDGSDLLVIDSGDRVEGNGLYDSSQPKGKYTYDIVKEQDIDILVCGNHELYKQNTSEAEYTQFIPRYKNNYVASNIDILDPSSGERVPLAQRFRKFKTKNQGIQVMAFGFIFSFQGSSDHAFVQKVEDAIKEQWFQDAIRDRSIDLFVVAGHAEIRSNELSIIYDEIRKQQWDAPIMFFGGHLHVRDYKRFDSKAYGLASGRYMETIGFQSISGLSIGAKGAPSKALASPTFARRYIDNNLFSLYHHSSTNKTTFTTSRGANVTEAITSARHALGLDKRFGCAPRDLWTNRAPYPSESSIFTWLADEVLPEMVQDSTRKNNSRIVVVNTGTMRFDIFKGAFTRDTTFIIQPFTNGFKYIPDVPFDKADKLITLLNQGGQIAQVQEDGTLFEDWMLLSPQQRSIRQSPKFATLIMETANSRDDTPIHRHALLHDGQQMLLAEEPPTTKSSKYQALAPTLNPGYTTFDDAGSDGDDTEHSPIQFYKVPNVFESRINATNVDKVDVIFIDFIQPWILSGLKFLGAEYTANDTKSYAGHADFTTLISNWVTRHWNATEC